MTKSGMLLRKVEKGMKRWVAEQEKVMAENTRSSNNRIGVLGNVDSS